MKKLLPITEPIIKSYPYHANLISMLQANNFNNTLPWILDTYINISIPDFPHDIKMDFYVGSIWKNCPFVYYQRISRNLVNKKWDNICDFLINCIDDNTYIYLLVDHYYLPPSFSYMKKYFVHDLFISGYDLEKQQFFVSDNFKDGVYSSTSISFEELEDAYLSINDVDDWLSGIELIKYRANRIHWFDPLKIKEKIEQYLQSYNLALYNRNPGEYWKTGYFYGSSVYEQILSHFELLLLNKTNTRDIRPFHVLYEHKVIIHKLIKYLEQHNFIESLNISEKFSKIVDQTLILRNMYVKYKVTKKINLVDRMKETVKVIYEEENQLLTELCHNIHYVKKYDQNLLQYANILSSSNCLSKHRGIDKIKNPDLNLVYRSDDNPTFPIFIDISWDTPYLINEIQIKTRFAQSMGITAFYVEAFSEKKWTRILEKNSHVYYYDDYTIETLYEKFKETYLVKDLRIVITQANIKWGRFEINWMGLFGSAE